MSFIDIRDRVGWRGESDVFRFARVEFEVTMLPSREETRRDIWAGHMCVGIVYWK